ncbi:U32 family peptidase [Paenibacillus thalictri]|uniref:U32 family peptidase n=2 Tax=Paenibacillus thalictri TaxID=2527873 RepID=A0A4Q9E0T3_9BACL|nr:U32 family peptidase [Paenibacillus thalictri]
MLRYIEAGADAVQVGEHRFGMRLPGEIKLDELAVAIPEAHAKGAKVYVVVNNIIDNDTVSLLPEYLQKLKELQADAIVFGDPAVLMAARQAAPGIALHWNTEMTSTNYATANYWASKGASRVILARELNMDQVLEIKRHAKLEVQVQVHGTTNIYHSKRSLLVNYTEHQGAGKKKSELGADQGLYLIEEERRDERYPVYEDINGTHIMSSDDICMLESVHELLEGGVDSVKIESLLKSVRYNETAVRCYRSAIDAYYANPQQYSFDEGLLEEIQALQPKNRELSFGFFYKEQVY